LRRPALVALTSASFGCWCETTSRQQHNHPPTLFERTPHFRPPYSPASPIASTHSRQFFNNRINSHIATSTTPRASRIENSQSEVSTPPADTPRSLSTFALVHIHILTYLAAPSGQWLRKTTTAHLACGLVAQSKSSPPDASHI
jgi:hypothetical protein